MSRGGRLFCVGELFFQRVDALEELGQPLLQHGDPALEHEGDGGVAVDEAAGGNVGGDAGLAAGLAALADGEVAGEPGLAAEDDVVLQGRAAGDADLGAQDGSAGR